MGGVVGCFEWEGFGAHLARPQCMSLWLSSTPTCHEAQAPQLSSIHRSRPLLHLCRGSFEDLVLLDGRLRWGRLENLFEEGAKSQDFDPQQVGDSRPVGVWDCVYWLPCSARLLGPTAPIDG